MKDAIIALIILVIALTILSKASTYKECPKCGGEMFFDGYKNQECADCSYNE